MKTKTAFIAIVGRPNVGKSTLLNHIIGEKIAIVSDKPQTTRTRITGIITNKETQLVFLDTPGWHKPQNKLSDFMVAQVKESLADVDVVLFVTTAVGALKPEEIDLLKNLKLRGLPVIVILNKIDQVADKERMIPKIEMFSSEYGIHDIIPISARSGQGVPLVLEGVDKYAKESPHFFPEDEYTDQPEKILISEIIREKLLGNLWEELPHGIAVGVENMSQRQKSQIVDINATIVCERATHKGMIIGKQGKNLKRIGTQAREDIERFLGAKVNLQLWVKVKEDWRNKDNIMKQLGFQ